MLLVLVVICVGGAAFLVGEATTYPARLGIVDGTMAGRRSWGTAEISERLLSMRALILLCPSAAGRSNRHRRKCN